MATYKNAKMKGFKMVVLPPKYEASWQEKIAEAVPGSIVKVFANPKDAIYEIQDADCAFGDVIPDLFARATKLRWIQCYAAGPAPSFFHDALVRSDVVVTNFRGIYNDHLSAHAMAFVLALARRFTSYIPQQFKHQWNLVDPAVHLPDSTALIIGVGGIGSETARLCASFGMYVIGTDPRIERIPAWVNELHSPSDLDLLLPRADFVIITTPETPQTRGMINRSRLNKMKTTAYLINIGRGACVILDDLVEALHSKKIAGAGLDVFESEPLPPDNPLWDTSGVLLTPHVGVLDGHSPHILERRTSILLENCKRFARGDELLNVVDKKNWY